MNGYEAATTVQNTKHTLSLFSRGAIYCPLQFTNMRVCKRLHWRPRHASGSIASPLYISRSEFDKYSPARRVAHLLSTAVNAIYRRVFGYSIREEMTDARLRDATVTFVLGIRMLLRGGSSRRSCVVFCCCVEMRRENPSSSSFTGKSFIAPYGRERKKQNVLPFFLFLSRISKHASRHTSFQTIDL